MDRDVLGRVVREAWVRWAKTQPDPKPHWLSPYDELSEPDKEADRQIAEAVMGYLNDRRIELALKMSQEGLSESENIEFSELQGGYFNALEVVHPSPPSRLDEIEALEARLNAAAGLEGRG